MSSDPDYIAPTEATPTPLTLEEKMDKILAITERVEGVINTVADQVKPVLDDLMKSPLLKMLGVKPK